ncbi:MAG: hypothetical protein WD468_11325 [Pirellulales bacterium]
MLNSCCGCSGCDGEMYWSEWHNDPPCCHDPCDCYGNWTGGCSGRGGCCGGDGGYCEPYEHAYCPTCSNGNGPNRGYGNSGYYAGRSAMSSGYVARNAAPSAPRGVAAPAATQVARRSAPAYVTRSAAPAPAQRVSANPNPWRGSSRNMSAQPIANRGPVATRGQLTRKPVPPTYNTFQR